MAQFVGYRNLDNHSRRYSSFQSQYIYERDGKQYSITSGMLNSLFKTHGYCVDPTVKTGTPLTQANVEILKNLADQNRDYALVETIKTLSVGKAPSPRMPNDGMMHETTLTEKYRFEHLTADERIRTQNLLGIILEIGLYLIGWKGNDEPYPIMARPISDIVRMELKIFPLIESVYKDPYYPLVKNFPITEYYHGSTLKPNVVETSLTIDHCLNRISVGMSQDYRLMGTYLISTAYYYITTICKTPLPMIDPLIRSFVTILS
jgi:hypothetical protein